MLFRSKTIVVALPHSQRQPAPPFGGASPLPSKQTPEGESTPGPTLPPAQEASHTLKIQGIMADPKGNVALIDGKVYAEGDDIDGAKIVRISLDSIVISRDGKEETLSARH